jgi:hypothetical protein
LGIEYDGHRDTKPASIDGKAGQIFGSTDGHDFEEKIYAKLQDAARQSRYAYALIVGYLDRLTPSLKVEDDHGTKQLVLFL